MDKPPLGKLEPVDLRTYWVREDTEFTPWLAQEENLRALGDALDLNLRFEGKEVQVGPFRADILAHELTRDLPVLIENQLERTDHAHLGALMTYAGGLEAAQIVWIASRFVEEHRAALDWLNSVTHEDVNFFGVQVELWRIGDSPPAPRFSVVSKPNQWSKSVAAGSRAGSRLRSPIYEDYYQFWSGFADYVADKKPGLVRPKPAARNWIEIGGSPEGVRVTVSYSAVSRQSRLYVLVRDSDSPHRYRYLEERAARLEERSGQEFEWHPQPDRGGGWFGWAGPTDLEVVDEPDVHYSWLAERLVPVIEALNELMAEFQG